MLKELRTFKCVCDSCGKRLYRDTIKELKDEMFFFEDSHYCHICYANYGNIDVDIGGFVICQIDDEPRHLFKNQEYEVKDVVYKKSSATREDKDRKAIMVDVRNGFLAKLYLAQYDV